MESPFDSTGDVREALRRHGYIADEEIALGVLLALGLGRPLLVEGPAGTGKTELAKAVARATGSRVVRLQCHEAVDESRALYEWDYRKQLLALQGSTAADGRSLYSEEYLLVRPLLEALLTEDPVVLLVDEVDRLGIESEALLLEFLAERQVTIPELGTVTAARNCPVVLTSNNTRELSEAVRRRCVFLHVDYPTPEREQEILLADQPGLSASTAERITTTVATLRNLDLRKSPSVAETLDWARALPLIGAGEINLDTVRRALPLLLKSQADVAAAIEALRKE